MKVLLVSSLERGGPLEQTLMLAPALADLGAHVRVTCADTAVARRFAAAGVPALALGQRPGLDVGAGVRVWRQMAKADIVHSQDRRSGLWVRLAPGMKSVARIYSVHGLPEAYMPAPLGSDHPSLRDRIAYQGIDAQLCRRADAVIIPSRTLATTFERRLSFPGKRIRVVPNGIDGVPVITSRGPEVGTLSLLEPVKDIGTFLAAARLLARERPELRFMVAGDGSERGALERLAEQLGIAPVVHFTGHIDRDEAMRRLSILVMPSISETAPMALLEAMAAGIPVVASRVGGIPELVGDAATLVDPGDARGFADAIASLLDDPSRTAAQVASGRARVQERYTTATNAAATLKVYEEALSLRARR